MIFSYITKAQLLEGLVGGLAWVVFNLYVKDMLNWSVQMKGVVLWAMVWYTRKLSLNMYAKYND